MPRPVGRQREVLYLPGQGHTVVLGTAGSGKTTLAILRSLYLADPSTPHSGRTLLVTFNRCLVTYMEHLAGMIPQLTKQAALGQYLHTRGTVAVHRCRRERCAQRRGAERDAEPPEGVLRRRISMDPAARDRGRAGLRWGRAYRSLGACYEGRTAPRIRAIPALPRAARAGGQNVRLGRSGQCRAWRTRRRRERSLLPPPRH